MKLSISRLLETSKFLATESGKELADFIQYVSDLAENVIRALQNNLTFEDNFRCKVAKVTLRHNVEQVVNTDGKRPSGILVLQVVSQVTGVSTLVWYTNNAGQTVLKAKFDGAPTVPVDVSLAILFP